MFDYVRVSSLELVAEEIYDKAIDGAVAELGVYRGDFAKIINEAFPDRKLYLFDTFEGFDDRDTNIEKEKKFSEGDQDFSDTNIELVLSKMKHPENCIVKKGYFPDTAKDVNESFVFVSIDADLYEPIYNGLVYFYKNMEGGGVIFVHDYNNDVYKGAKEAVRKFCAENDIGYFPLSDACGTAVIIKP
ncbi:MAG: TylF/MycF family methyltransferase [Methanomassiliicoccaceae archaeon]|nr:TylF/MycF family methyltransferase [Methanomassiliicoccaceae archaeon]